MSEQNEGKWTDNKHKQTAIASSIKFSDLLSDFKTLNDLLNHRMWQISNKMPDGLEDVLTTMESLIKNIDNRLRSLGI